VNVVRYAWLQYHGGRIDWPTLARCRAQFLSYSRYGG